MQDTAIVTSYFNPAGYRTKQENYNRFAAGIRAIGAELWTVECTFGEQPFDLPEGPRHMRIRGRDVLWQKERLLNECIRALPANYTKVVWLDCDILFENPIWLEQTSKLLDEVAILQPFASVVRLARSNNPDDEDSDSHDSFAATWVAFPQEASSGDFWKHGHTGYAWAGRRELLEDPGLYEFALSGNADHLMAHAFTNTLHCECIDHCAGAAGTYREHFSLWAEHMAARCGASLGVVPGRILHLWHGDTSDRHYHRRAVEFQEMGFNPATDVGVDANGALVWTNASADLRNWSRGFFGWRREDG